MSLLIDISCGSYSSGQLPSAAELNYLDKVKWLEMYGVDLHPVLVKYNITSMLGHT